VDKVYEVPEPQESLIGAMESSKMEKWLGIAVVLFVLVLNFLARKRSCGSCKSCDSSCGGGSSYRKTTAPGDAAHVPLEREA
jgi:hypothetical protein